MTATVQYWCEREREECFQHLLLAQYWRPPTTSVDRSLYYSPPKNYTITPFEQPNRFKMKVSTSLFTLTIASAATESQAVTCSSSDILGVTKLPQYATAMAACGTVDFSRPLDGTASICGKSTCVDALRAYAQVLPKCDVNGVSFAVNFDAAL
jgi:hypothetical protein